MATHRPALALALVVASADALWGGTSFSDLAGDPKSLVPKFMLAGGVSQAKDSLLMMLMELPIAFQGAGVATRVPCVYRLVHTDDKGTPRVWIDQGSGAHMIQANEIVETIEKHMLGYGDGYSGDPIRILIQGDVESALYINMMGRLTGNSEKANQIDQIYKEHATPKDVLIIAVEKAQVIGPNSVIAHTLEQEDPTGSRTIYVKTWADFGLGGKSPDGYWSCAEVQRHFRSLDFQKPNPSAPTFWIPTVENEPYLTDPKLSFEERRAQLQRHIADKQEKMQNFFNAWKMKGCFFEFEKYSNVQQLRQYLSEIHKKVVEQLPALIQVQAHGENVVASES